MEMETLTEEGSLSQHPGTYTIHTTPETHLEADTHPAADTPRKARWDAVDAGSRKPAQTQHPSVQGMHVHTQ